MGTITRHMLFTRSYSSNSFVRTRYVSIYLSIYLSMCLYIYFLNIYTVYIRIYYTSIAARGGAGSFKRLKLYNSEEHVPIESFVTTLIH